MNLEMKRQRKRDRERESGRDEVPVYFWSVRDLGALLHPSKTEMVGGRQRKQTTRGTYGDGGGSAKSKLLPSNCYSHITRYKSV